MRDLIAALGYPIEPKADGGYAVSVETLTTVAAELSELVDVSPPWGWRYMHGVINGKTKASAKLAQAIFAWGAVVDGSPALLANTQDVVVRAHPGQLHPGSVVLASSRRCPACRVAFVPTVPWQRYCRPQCRMAGGSDGAADA
ncbi:MAG: hypothetical protein KF821_09135 [Anaerolineales bacterium]|nr:hypothetical protein [Anaerolineales bacterium]